METGNVLIENRYKRLEKVNEVVAYILVLIGLIIVQLPLPEPIPKTPVYIFSGFALIFLLTWHRLLPARYSGMKKNLLESIAGIFGIFVLTNLTGGISSYFSFLYFLPVLSSSIYMPKSYSRFIVFSATLLLLASFVRFFSSSDFALSVSLAGLQVWAIWLIYAHGRFLGGEVSLEKKREEEIKLEEIREIEKLKDEFIFIVSHELRSPITAIRGYLEFLITDDSLQMSDKYKSILKKAFITSNRLTNLVTLLLEAARLETGKIQFYTQKTSVAESLERIKFGLKNEIEEKSVDLVDKVPGDLLVKVDPERLDEILNIVVGNAINYTPEFGTVEISTVKRNSMVEIKIEDSGVGMTKEKRELLFEKFYTEKLGIEKKSIKGINIGMYVVKQLLLKMAGDISVDSRLGEGTKFTISLPNVTKHTIKAVIFDAGGVLFNSAETLFSEPIKYIAKTTGRRLSEVDKAYRETIVELESKESTQKDLWSTINKKLGSDVSLSQVDPIAVGFKKFKKNDEVFTLIDKLKVKYKIAIVSNANSVEAANKKAQDMYKFFDVVVLSFKVGVRKPNSKIYKTALERLKIKPEEAVFVDNTSENVKAANNLGLTGILFRDADQLEKDLSSVGIDLKL